MIIKSKLKFQRQVLFEKRSKYNHELSDVFIELTEDCKIMYNPQYKSRFFLCKNNMIFMSILNHGNSHIITINDYIIRLIASKYFKRKNTNNNWNYKLYGQKKKIFWAIEKFVKQYGYSLKHTESMTYSKKKEYNLSLDSLKYLHRGDNVKLRSGNLWFSV